MFGMGGNAGIRARGLRLGLLVAVAALFALIPAAQASAATEYTLKVNVEGEGLVYCDTEFEGEPELEFEECGDTELGLLEGTEVRLTAVEAGDEFKEFKGCVETGPEECEFEMDGPREVTVVFGPEPVAKHKLEVNVVGAGEVECELEEGPGPCLAEYPEEGEFGVTEVTLIPVESEGSKFVGFSGDCSGEECVLEMDADHSVTATFESEGSGEEESGGGEGSTSSPQPQPSLPIPVGPGKAKVSGAGLYKGGRAMLRISCRGGGPCRGRVKLIAKLKLGKKRKKVVVGKAAFRLSANRSKALTIKLSRPAKKLLGKGRTLTAKVRGRGVTASKIKIKPTER